jgi:hypothetical protein
MPVHSTATTTVYARNASKQLLSCGERGVFVRAHFENSIQDNLPGDFPLASLPIDSSTMHITLLERCEMSISRQYQVLNFVRNELAQGRPFPSIARIAQQLACGDSGARDCVDRLLLGGYIKRTAIRKFGNGIRSSYTLKSSKIAD